MGKKRMHKKPQEKPRHDSREDWRQEEEKLLQDLDKRVSGFRQGWEVLKGWFKKDPDTSGDLWGFWDSTLPVVLRIHQALKSKSTRLAGKLRHCLTKGSTNPDLVQKLACVQAQLEVVEKLLPKNTLKKPQEFVFSSVMLAESFSYCTERPEEGMQFVCGVDVDNLLLATKVMNVEYSARSVVYACGEDVATQRMTIDAHETGHLIIGLLHSHPGHGQDANYSSSIDRATQRRWENGRRFISGIWSRDGYLRFFSRRLPFTVRIVGNNIEQISDTLFKLNCTSKE